MSARSRGSVDFWTVELDASTAEARVNGNFFNQKTVHHRESTTAFATGLVSSLFRRAPPRARTPDR